MDIDRYLNRIGLKSRPAPTLQGLRALHNAHLLAIPYENLDVQLRRPVTIDRAPIYEKIVEGHRGGWCYEMPLSALPAGQHQTAQSSNTEK
jgi:N-hydroxyarylamine O-acetyltransferase